MNMFKILAPVLLATLLSGVCAASPRTLTLATTQWCPYTCGELSETENLIGTYLTELFTKHNLKLKIESYPWARAIQLAESGVVDGLLTAVKSEAPSLRFTSEPTGYYQVCFYTYDSAWRFESIADLTGKVLGVIRDYGYTPDIDRYVASQEDSGRIETVGGSLSTQRLIRMLQAGRIDALVEDRLVLASVLNQLGPQPIHLFEAGCAQAQPFYLALSPDLEGVDTILTLLNSELASKQNQQRLNQKITGITRQQGWE